MSDRQTGSESSALRVGVVGIFIHQSDSVDRVNHILKDFSHLFKGRLGVPRICQSPPVNVIALIRERKLIDEELLSRLMTPRVMASPGPAVLEEEE